MQCASKLRFLAWMFDIRGLREVDYPLYLYCAVNEEKKNNFEGANEGNRNIDGQAVKGSEEKRDWKEKSGRESERKREREKRTEMHKTKLPRSLIKFPFALRGS